MSAIIAKFETKGKEQQKPFNEEGEFQSWMIEAVQTDDTFKYLGKTTINNPVTWRYSKAGNIALFRGHHSKQPPFKTIKDPKEKELFAATILKRDFRKMEVGETSICDLPDYYSEKESEVAAYFTDNVPVITPHAMTSFEKWIRNEIHDRDLEERVWMINNSKKGKKAHRITNYDFLEIIIENMNHDTQNMIESVVKESNFSNEELNRYFRELASSYYHALDSSR